MKSFQHFHRAKPGINSRMRQGFTLVEMLVVIAILAMLVSLVTSGLHGSRKRAGTVVCAYNLKQIATAMIGYSVDHAGRLPSNEFILSPRVEDFFMHKIIAGNYLSGSQEEVATVFICPDVPLIKINENTAYAPVLSTYAVNISVVGLYNTDRWVYPQGFLYRVARPTRTVLVSDGYYDIGGGDGEITVYQSINDFRGERIGMYSVGYGNTAVRYAHDGRPQVAFADAHVEARNAPWPMDLRTLIEE